MIPNIHQSIEDELLNATPEQKILWQMVRLMTGENAAIQRLHYAGVLPTDLVTYDARKCYVCYEVSVGCNDLGQASGGVHWVGFADMTNTQFIVLHNNALVWNTTGAAVNYGAQYMRETNFWFSRISGWNNVSYVKFIGYRVMF